MIIELAKKLTNITATNIQYKMKKRKRDISEDTILRCLHEDEGKYIVKLSKPLLTSIHMKKWLQWTKKYRNFNWNQVIFTDKNIFYLNKSTVITWQFPG